MINTIQTALSGLFAATKRVEASAANIAGANTAGSLAAGSQTPPYTPVTTVQSTQTDANGNPISVNAENIPRNNPFTPVYSPDSPFADENGIIGVPNVNYAEEAVNLSIAKASYQANLIVLETVSELSEEVLRLVDDEA